MTRPSLTISVGGKPSKIRVALRLYGEELDPKALTDGLGVSASRSYQRGDLVSPRRSDAKRPHGMWLLESSLPPDAPLEKQIIGILDQLPELALWDQLTKMFQRDLFCGFFISHQISGISLSSTALASIASRGLDLDADVTIENEDND